MKELKEKFLPIGTVVLLKNATKRIMITGFCGIQRNANVRKTFDYCGCIYPEGYLSPESILLFDHDQIDKIYHVGLANDDEEREFKKKLKNVLESMEKFNKEISKIIDNEETSTKKTAKTAAKGKKTGTKKQTTSKKANVTKKNKTTKK